MNGGPDPGRCPACQKVLSPVWRDKCEHCGTAFTPGLVAARILAGYGVNHQAMAAWRAIVSYLRRYRDEFPMDALLVRVRETGAPEELVSAAVQASVADPQPAPSSAWERLVASIAGQDAQTGSPARIPRWVRSALWVLAGAIAGALLGLWFLDWVTGSGDPVIIMFSIIPLAIWGLSILAMVAVAFMRRSIVAFGVAGAVALGGFLASEFGPENPNAAHSVPGQMTLGSIPAGFQWSGGASCTWIGGKIDGLRAVVPIEGGSMGIRLGVADYYFGAGAPGSGSETPVGIVFLATSPDRSSGQGTTAAFRSGNTFLVGDDMSWHTNPFAGKQATFAYSCQAQ